MASNDPPPDDAHEAESLLEPPDTEDDQVFLATESPRNDRTDTVTMAMEDSLTNDEADRIDDMTRRFLSISTVIENRS